MKATFLVLIYAILPFMEEANEAQIKRYGDNDAPAGLASRKLVQALSIFLSFYLGHSFDVSLGTFSLSGI